MSFSNFQDFFYCPCSFRNNLKNVCDWRNSFSVKSEQGLLFFSHADCLTFYSRFVIVIMIINSYPSVALPFTTRSESGFVITWKLIWTLLGQVIYDLFAIKCSSDKYLPNKTINSSIMAAINYLLNQSFAYQKKK